MPSDYFNCQLLPGPLVYKRRAAVAVNWLCNFAILLAVTFDVGRSKAAVLLEQRHKGLLFVHHARPHVPTITKLLCIPLEVRNDFNFTLW